MTHHAINHHAGVNDPLYYNDNSSQIRQILSKYDVDLAITGHIHITNIAKNGTLTDMSVPSTSTYPLSLHDLAGLRNASEGAHRLVRQRDHNEHRQTRVHRC